MFTTKRFLVATIVGLITGFICFALASSSPGVLPDAVAYQIIISRALAGFAIGISVFRIGHWSIHGGVIGFLFSLPLAFSGLMAPEVPEFSKTAMFIMTILLGVIYGIIIELFTTVFFKARMHAVDQIIKKSAGKD